jgi:hypothetical protein
MLYYEQHIQPLTKVAFKWRASLLDQMFTPENFRRVYDRENRKGVDVCGRYFPALQPYTTNVRNKADEIHRLRQQKATIKADVFEARLTQLKKELKELKSKKSKAVDAALESVSSNVLKSSFRLSIKQNARPNRKTVYCVNDVAEYYFVVKQLQFILYKIYKIKQSNRDHLVCQLRDCLKSGFPFSIVRTDVSSFYESIDRSKLIAKLDEDNLLTFLMNTERYLDHKKEYHAELALAHILEKSISAKLTRISSRFPA